MSYTTLEVTRNKQNTLILVDNETTLPPLFITIYALKNLRRKQLSTQRNIHRSLKFFYVYFFKKHKITFDYAFHEAGYNISKFIYELDGFFNYLLGQQHLNNEKDILGLEFMLSGITKANKVTYGGHIRHVGGFFKYLNYRYMNVSYQNMSPMEAHQISKANKENLAYAINNFNKIKVSQNEPAHRYKSITEMQSIELMNMLIPSTPAFTDVDTGENVDAVINPINPFEDGFQQNRNYLMHRFMYNYGLRVGEVQLLMTDSIGETLPDSRGKTRFVMVVQNLPDDVDDPRKHKPSIKTQHSYREIELTEDDFIMVEIFKNRYRTPLFEEKGIEDHGILFIKGFGKLTPFTYDGIRTIYKNKIDPTFIGYHPYYRTETNKKIDYMVKLNPHVGRHTWAYITLEYIYNEILKENLIMASDYGIRARMNGELDAAVEKLRSLGGWSNTSKVPLMYAKRFIEMVSNLSNKNRTKRADWQAAIPPKPTPKSETESTYNPLEDDGYDEDIPFDLFD
ncbi:site-specific integrase [Photobacterium phosphoreum]|uniref:site-specific integrase n=1 Tax=Photobacterium phosphoreum TaxID=659 RepID=UPI001E549B6F|nr:site-specific integrase [Photobacterium phosphoreum]MCD9474232.1 site-specific integrase [Photobacterium phosphoreum]MCF2175021.1 site-specific integrase [Photobacterium phosphoreum]